MTVYVVHPLGDKIDLTAALVYGEVEYINHGYIYSDTVRNERPPSRVIDLMEVVAEKFEPKKDYLLIAGDHLQLILMTAVLAVDVGEFKVLRYDREAGGYVSVIIPGP